LVLIELKACENLIPEHGAQTLHYLRATDIEVALLMNFGPLPKFKRLALNNELKKRGPKSVSSVSIGVKPLADPEVIS
jgi:hypothetical protein